MKYSKNLITYLIIIMIGSIYAQDNIINEIAKGGKFIIRSTDQKEAMVIEESNVDFKGTMKLGILPKGNLGNSIVVWDPDDKLIKILDQKQSTDLTYNIKNDGWQTLGYNGLADSNTTAINAIVQSTNSTLWTESGNLMLIDGMGSGTIGGFDEHHSIAFREGCTNSTRYYEYGGTLAQGNGHRFYTGGYKSFQTEKMRIANDGIYISGNVGIGTTNPSAKLDIVGQVKITGGTPGIGKVLMSDATGLASWQTPAAGGGSTLWTESGSNIFRTDGNVGIGTTNPSAKLDIVGQVKITGGTPGIGKVLMSDATGLASWQTPAAGGGSTLWTESGSNIFRTDGNVGIGTTNPSAKLDIVGQVKITGGTPGIGKVLMSDATGLASWQTPAAGGGSTLWTESGSNIFRTDGNVGIGTTNPSAKLDIVGQVKITGGTPGIGKVLMSDATGLASWQTPAAGGGSTLWTESGSNIFRTDGNVGIGIINPTQPLQISTAKWQGVELVHSILYGGVGGMRWTGLASYNNRSWLMFTNDTPITSGSGNDGGLMFRTNNGTTGSTPRPRMVIAQNGNVGIGTTNPSAKLEVAGQVKITGGIPGLGKVLTSDGIGLATWQTPAEGDGATLWTESGSNVYRTDGNVGIGTTNPSAKLEVVGQVKITGGIPGLGKVLTSDGIGLATWQTPAEGGGATLWTESGSNVYRTDGNIGIGTANPTTKLDINGTTSAKRYVVAGLYNITNGVWEQSQGNLAQITYSSGITPITINSDGSAGTYVLVVKKTASCTDCNISFLGGDVKFPGGVNPTLSSGTNTIDIFSFIAVGNNTFYCLYAKNLL